jgi:hypothetical protein
LDRLVSASGSAWHGARLAMCRAEGAGRWLTVVGSDSERILRDDSYRMAVRLRLGLPPMDVMTAHCHSCRAPIMDANAPLLKQDMWHWLGCTNGVAGAALQQRHNRVRNVLRDHVLRAKGVARLEPTNLGDDNKRSDLSSPSTGNSTSSMSPLSTSSHIPISYAVDPRWWRSSGRRSASTRTWPGSSEWTLCRSSWTPVAVLALLRWVSFRNSLYIHATLTEPGLRPRSMVTCVTLWRWPSRMATGGLSTPLTSTQLVNAGDNTHTFTHTAPHHIAIPRIPLFCMSLTCAGYAAMCTLGYPFCGTLGCGYR